MIVLYMDKIKVEILNKQKRVPLESSFLTLKFTNTPYHFVNSIRRLLYNDIPTYAFSDINIQINTSKAYHNDIIKMRLRQLPIYNVKTDEIVCGDSVDGFHKIQLYISEKNTTMHTTNVTTNKARVLVDGVETKMYNEEYPILIIKLQPNEEFQCVLNAKLGYGRTHSMWNSVSAAYYEIDDKDIINLTVKSSGSCTEIDLLKRACLIAIYKLDQIKKQIEDEYNGNKSKDIEIYIENADETLINPLNYIIQSYKEIKFSGMSKPTMLESTMKLSIVANEGSAINYVYNAIDELKKVYNYLENAI